MKTKTTVRIVSETQKTRLGYFDYEAEEWIEITPENAEDSAKILSCSDALLMALIFSLELLTDNIHADLASIWKRLDAM